MDFIVDTDVVSMFCKIEKIALLKRIFPYSKIYITQETTRELERAKKLGFDYLDDVAEIISVIELDKEVFEKSKKIAKNNEKLHLTEIYGILLCKKKRMIMVTNDKVAKEFCRSIDVAWMDIVEILRFGFVKKRINKDESWKIIGEIEEKDKTRIKNAERIFEG
ncbi:MAG: hypothetical protein WBA22_17080 [Candidatus Methanofastidiosia archaeon]|jgi:predicted nucleic acid-binding protein